jgi:hypothetical protein
MPVLGPLVSMFDQPSYSRPGIYGMGRHEGCFRPCNGLDTTFLRSTSGKG